MVGITGAGRDITERKRAEEEIIRKNEFLYNVIESLTHPFYVLDANDFTIKMANSAAAPNGLPEGVTCHALTHLSSGPCQDNEHLCPLQVIKKTKQPLMVEHIHYDREGNARNVEVHAYPVFDKEGSVVQIIEYSFDITARKKLEEALRKSIEKIKLFAYSVSHDLKSPAVGIHGLTKLLHKQYGDTLDERGQRYCDLILKASEQVVELVEEINIFIKTKETPLRFETLDLDEILRLVRQEFAAKLDLRRVKWSQPERLPDIKADRLCLVRVLRNLVDNALKYGGEHLSRISIGYEESREWHTFSVRDDGIGIRQEDSQKIFELFHRNQQSESIEGTGLGLAIVREMVEKHNGTVWAEPASPRGTTFYFTISRVL